MGLKVCFAGFCHHSVTTMSVHTHAYRFESRTKNRSVNNHFMQERYVSTKNDSKVDFSYNDNLCAGYVD